VFSLLVKPKAPIQVKDLFQLNDSYTPSEAYNLNAELLGLSLETMEKQTELILFQNRPNPFNKETVIGFYLPNAGPIDLSVYDQSGRLIKSIKKESKQGYQEVTIHRSDLNESNVLYYRIITSDGTATKKMVVTN